MESDPKTVAIEGNGGKAQAEPGTAFSIPDHELLRQIGKGSYGEVWLARNQMGLYRAVKIVSRSSFTHQRPFERELSGIKKFEPISRSHSGFVDVLHVGINEAKGYFYYVMELGDDQSSGQTIDSARYVPKTLAREMSLRGKLSLPDCQRLGIGLSEALAELHAQGLVHRDIKPSNIIFVNGTPKLADIGLVAGVDEAQSYVGTEGFIPPEGPGTPQADIYSLGKVLYEISTGKDRTDFPELPTNLGELEVEEGFLELNEVVLKACKQEVRKRYQTAAQMRADLLALANGQSVRRLRQLERRMANLKRLGLVSAAVFVGAGALISPTYLGWRARIDLRQQEVGSHVANGTRAVESGDFLGALPYFAEALRLDQGDPVRSRQHRLRFGSTLAQCPRVVQLWVKPDRIAATSFSPDGQLVLVGETFGGAHVIDWKTGTPISRTLADTNLMWRASFSSDGQFVLTAGDDHCACVWRVSDGELIWRMVHSDIVMAAGFSPDGLQVVTGCDDRVARVWDLGRRNQRLKLEGHTGPVLFAAFSPDGRRIVTTSWDSTVRLWDAQTGKSIGGPLVHPSWASYAVFSRDGSRLVTACYDHKVRVWDLASGVRLAPDMDHDDGVRSVEFSPDGRLLISACLDGTARLWDGETHLPFRPNAILRHSDRVMHATFSPDGHHVITGCVDGSVRVWDLAGGEVMPPRMADTFSEDGSRFCKLSKGQLQVLDSATGEETSRPIAAGEARSVKLSPDGRFVLTTSKRGESTNQWDRMLEVWETESGRRVGVPLLISNEFVQFVVSRDGSRLLGYGNAGLGMWSTQDGERRLRPELQGKGVDGAIFDRGGKWLAAWLGEVVRVWDTTSGRELFEPLVHAFPVRHVEFNADGTRLVSCGADATFNKCWAQVRAMPSGQPIGPALMHGDGVLWAAFSEDGRRLVTAGEDFAARIWEIGAGSQVGKTLRHREQVAAASFSPDRQWVVTASADLTARIWSADTGEPLTPPLQHPWVARAQFVADGRKLLTGDSYGNAWLWELPVIQRPPTDLVKLARFLSGGALLVTGGNGAPAKPGALEPLWQELRAKYPADFTTGSEQVAGWHAKQARVNEGTRQWFGAAFHLQRLQRLRPEDPEIAARLKQAKEHLLEKR